jgi:NitT/TauT family transport system substrate-binding protein
MKTIVSLVALVLGVSLAPIAATAADQIRILCPTWSGYAPIFVAQELGYFKALGLDVSLKFEDERPNVMAAMERKEIEMDMRTVGEYQGRPRSPETPGIIIGTIDESLGGDGVIADGSVKTVADLKGKTVASEANIPGRLLLQLDLRKHGLTLKDLQLKEIATADSVAVFADTSVAAVATYEPYLSQTIKNNPGRKPKELVSSKDYPAYITDVIIVRQDDLKANPKKYKNFLIGVYKAVAYFNADKANFIKLAAPRYNLSPEDFAGSIDGSLVYTGFAESSKLLGKPGAPGTLFQVFDTVMGLNLENGAGEHKLSAAASIDNSVMASISESDLK